MFRLRLGFSGETLLCFANIIHTSTECSSGCDPRLRTRKFLSNPCGPSPCNGLSPSLTTMAAPTPVRFFNDSPSSPIQGERTGLPRSQRDPFHRRVGFSCTPIRCRLTSPSSSAGLHLVSHCRFASTDRLFTALRATEQLPDDFHPISIVSRMLTLWALLTEISCVTMLRLRLAGQGS